MRTFGSEQNCNRFIFIFKEWIIKNDYDDGPYSTCYKTFDTFMTISVQFSFLMGCNWKKDGNWKQSDCETSSWWSWLTVHTRVTKWLVIRLEFLCSCKRLHTLYKKVVQAFFYIWRCGPTWNVFLNWNFIINFLCLQQPIKKSFHVSRISSVKRRAADCVIILTLLTNLTL